MSMVCVLDLGPGFRCKMSLLPDLSPGLVSEWLFVLLWRSDWLLEWLLEWLFPLLWWCSDWLLRLFSLLWCWGWCWCFTSLTCIFSLTSRPGFGSDSVFRVSSTQFKSKSWCFASLLFWLCVSVSFVSFSFSFRCAIAVNRALYANAMRSNCDQFSRLSGVLRIRPFGPNVQQGEIGGKGQNNGYDELSWDLARQDNLWLAADYSRISPRNDFPLTLTVRQRLVHCIHTNIESFHRRYIEMTYIEIMMWDKISRKEDMHWESITWENL